MTQEAATPPKHGPRAVAVEDTLRSDRVGREEAGCFTDDGAAAYLGGALDDGMRDTMRSHLDSCDACRSLVMYAARGLGSSTGTSAPRDDAKAETAPFTKVEQPHRIGRFTILDLIGAGGMGVVYSAFDNELDRKIALKLVRTELRDAQPEATRNAMAREAKAMAKIDHPNVITVFEVGTHEDQIFVAMELVVGGDLRAWMKTAPRTWRELLAVCQQAGLGLAAAHHAGLVHRDFKPDNVLVGKDGRVRVTDFGLARAIEDATRPSYVALSAPAVRPSDRLTRTGAVVGTPAYMAPEQHRGEAADARSDQFAFCVTVWEALYGQRPFAGDDFATIANNVRDGAMREPAANDVPPRVHDALKRGLRAEPAERFPTMDDLVAELGLAIEPPRKRRRVLLAAAIPAVLALGAGAWFVFADKPSDAACPTAESKLTGVWDAKRSADTTKALAGVGQFGADVAQRVTAGLDSYTQQWASAWGEACATNARREQSSTMFDLRVACLMRRLHAVDAVATALGKRDPAVVTRAMTLIDGLAPISDCSNTESLARAAPPPELFMAVAEIDELLEKAQGQRMAGNMPEARRLADQGLAAAERIRYRPSIAGALFTIAELEYDQGAYAEAEKLLQRASTEAISSGHDEGAAQILTELADVVGYELARPQEAHRLVEIARGAIERIGSPPIYKIDLLITESRIWLMEGKHEPAIASLDEAEKLARQIGDEMRLIPIVSAKGLIVLEEGKFDDAAVLVEQQLDLRGRHEGKHHPNYASALEARATVHFAKNAFDKGLADLAEARRIKTAALGPDSPELLTVENNSGIIAGLLGDWEEALRSARFCHVVSEKQNGLEHPGTALAIANEGAALRELGRLAEAEPLVLQQLEIRKRVLGEEHADYAVGLTEVGELRLAQGKLPEAAQLFRDAEKILLAAIGADAVLIPYATWGLGVTQLRQGDLEGAKATLERTHARFVELDVDPIQSSETRLALGETMWQLGDKAGARKIVADSSIALAKLPQGTNKVLRAKIDTWLASHR